MRFFMSSVAKISTWTPETSGTSLSPSVRSLDSSGREPVKPSHSPAETRTPVPSGLSRADRIFDCFRHPDPATSGTRRRAESAVRCPWATPQEDGWGTGGAVSAALATF